MKYKALQYRYKAEIAIAKAELSNYFENPVAVGDHPHLINSMDGLVGQLAQGQEKLAALEYFVRYQDDIE